jgi:predicted nucleic acid-binding protein
VYLIDSSVFTRMRRPAVAEAMESLAPFDLRYSPITGLELRFSAGNETEWDLFDTALGEYTREPVLPADFDRADEVQRSLAKQGLKRRKPADLIIAAQAERLDLSVLHYDRDFELIASVTEQAQQWIVLRGSMD